MGQTSVGQPAPLTTTAHKDSEELAGRQPQAKGVRNRRCVLRPPAEGPRAGKVELGLFQIAMGHNTKAVSQCREGHGPKGTQGALPVYRHLLGAVRAYMVHGFAAIVCSCDKELWSLKHEEHDALRRLSAIADSQLFGRSTYC